MIEKLERVCYTGGTGSQNTQKGGLPFHSEGLSLQTKEEWRDCQWLHMLI